MSLLLSVDLYSNSLVSRMLQFTGSLPESIASLDDLKVLYLDNNNFSGTLHEAYGNLRDVQTMFLFNNQLIGTM